MFAAQVPDEAVKAAVETALRSSNVIVDQGVLGACLMLSLMGNIALVWLLVRVQNMRVKDQLAINEVAKEMVGTFAKVDGTLEDLNKVSNSQNTILQGVTNTLNTLMMGLVTRGASIFHPPPPSSNNHGSGGTTP
jgi:hypothetical protein